MIGSDALSIFASVIWVPVDTLLFLIPPSLQITIRDPQPPTPNTNPKHMRIGLEMAPHPPSPLTPAINNGRSQLV